MRISFKLRYGMEQCMGVSTNEIRGSFSIGKLRYQVTKPILDKIIDPPSVCKRPFHFEDLKGIPKHRTNSKLHAETSIASKYLTGIKAWNNWFKRTSFRMLSRFALHCCRSFLSLSFSMTKSTFVEVTLWTWHHTYERKKRDNRMS